MIQAVQIKLVGTSVTIANGPFLGHECTNLIARPSAAGGVWYGVGAESFRSLEAALNAAQACAYRYVAQQLEGEDMDARARAERA